MVVDRSTWFDKEYFESRTKNELGDYWIKHEKAKEINAGWIIDLMKILNVKKRRVLDLGCAYGQTVRGLVNKGIDAYGVDISEYSIEEGKKRQPKIADRLLCKNIEDEDFAEEIIKKWGKFDFVTSQVTLEHILEGKVDTVIKNIYDITEGGGFSYHNIDNAMSKDITHYCVHGMKWWQEKFMKQRFIPYDTNAELKAVNWYFFKKATNG